MRARTLVWALLGGAPVGLLLAAACSSTDGGGPTAGSCAPTDPACPAISADCLALVDNTGASAFTLRMAQLSISRPAVLANDTFYGIVSDGVNINQPACNVSGKGTFCWLLHFDTARGTLKTGGALPASDPTTGYCFQDEPAADIEPVEVEAPLGADGTFEAGPIPYLSVPIYLDITATMMVRLPLHDITITNASVSADHNCIGRFNATGLEPINNCKPDPSRGIEYFVNGAQLDGYISLEDADTVVVDVANQSLCVLLSGDAATYGDGGSPNRCRRDASGTIELPGDWCSTTNSAGGCADAVRLSAGIAASAVLLRDDCPSGTGGSGAGGGGSGGSSAGGGGSGGLGGATGGAGGAGGG